MKISIKKIEAKTKCNFKVIINAIKLESREVISGYYVDKNGKKVNMSWDDAGINDGSTEPLWIPTEYIKGVLAGAVKVAKKLNKLREP